MLKSKLSILNFLILLFTGLNSYIFSFPNIIKIFSILELISSDASKLFLNNNSLSSIKLSEMFSHLFLSCGNNVFSAIINLFCSLKQKI